MQSDGGVVVLDLVKRSLDADGGHQLVESRQEIPDLNIVEVDGPILLGQFDRRPPEAIGVCLRPAAQFARRLAEGPVGQQLPYQIRPRVQQVLAVVLLRRRLGQEHSRLDLHQRRRHDQEVPHHLRVQHLQQAHVSQVLLEDASDGDIVDIHLVPADQVQKQLHRAAVGVQLDAVVLHRGVILPEARRG